MEQFCDPNSGQVLGVKPVDYLPQIPSSSARDVIVSVRAERLKQISHEQLAPYRKALTQLPTFKTKNLDFSKPQVTIGDISEFDEPTATLFQESLKQFIPWKKGPYNLFGTAIDTEWRSDMKWDRILPYINLKGKKVADIGCHNGYFMFRICDQEPELVVGMEPMPLHILNFHLMQRFAQMPNLHYEMLGIEHVDLYPKFFDTVFCLGILYHHTDPISMLRKIHASLRAGGELLIDCQGIPGDAPVALMPQTRYAHARGIWWLPTLPALKHWLTRTMFRDIQVIHAGPLESDEQRSSKWAQINSLDDFLDPEDKSKTIEGYPAPHRFYLKCKK